MNTQDQKFNEALNHYNERMNHIYVRSAYDRFTRQYGNRRDYKMGNLLSDAALELCGSDYHTGSVVKLIARIKTSKRATKLACEFLRHFA